MIKKYRDLYLKMEMDRDNNVNIAPVPAYAILPFFMAGLKNSLNPCSVTVIALLVFLFLYIFIERKRIYVFGIIFVTSVLVTSLYWEWLSFVTPDGFDDTFGIVRLLCLGVASFVLLFGFLNFFDWGILRFNGDKSRMLLQFPKMRNQGDSGISGARLPKEGEKGKSFWLALPLIAIITGIIAGVFISAFPIPTYLLAMIYIVNIEGGGMAVFLYLFFYHVIMALPLIATLVIIVLTSPWNKLVDALDRYAPAAKIMIAGISFALGTGLLYLFY